MELPLPHGRWDLVIDVRSLINISVTTTGRRTYHKGIFTKSLPQQDVTKWTKIVEAWEADRTKLNPFARTVANKTEAAMHLQLAQEDAQDKLAGLDGDEFHTTLLKDMILQGIQLEASQWRITWLNKELGLHLTPVST
ncbi:hypothetical protein EDD18DRAFT_1362378 [Armillaria luteobubalina]|uniref:Uncharacterized protein n=1 Tax=Armillaria luteobubalina TaxID=153913 RepID=A0AA39PGG7_9AGAR|nr:hypothetical protein EDD18DRAFT_1362378 [Armillaria luteobubalina]